MATFHTCHLMKVHDQLENYTAASKVRFQKVSIMLFDGEGYIPRIYGLKSK